ncbi:MAG: hypothetical protein IPL36_06575 [Nigerium sp.]|nr:hypothetical protein [Nigerium sp.]
MVDLISRTRPSDEALAHEWTPEQRRLLLDDVMAGRARRVPTKRRAWPVAVAASLAAALMLVVPVAVPGWLGTAAAGDLNDLARVAAAQTALEWGDTQFLRVQSVETQTGAPDAASQTPAVDRRVTHDDYYATDGWQWSDRTVNGRVERYLFSPGWGWQRPDYAATLPTEPHLLDAFLRLRVLGSTSQDEAVFIAIGDMLRAEAAPPDVRGAAIGVLGLNPRVSVEHTDDPQRRPALKVTFVDEAARPGQEQFLYLDPSTGLLLGNGTQWNSGSYQSAILRREVVDALPESLTGTVGTHRVAKEYTGGKVRLMPGDAGPDPVVVPEQTYTPRPAPEPTR